MVADHEPKPWFRAETKQAYQLECASKNMARDYLNARLFSSRTASQLREAVREGLVFVETSNRLTYIAPALADYFPKSRFIFLHRAPAAVIRSAMRRGYYVNNPWDPYRIEPNHDDQFSGEWPALSVFEKCCWYWRAVNEFSMGFIQTLAPGRCHTLASDSLFNCDHDQIVSLFDWIGVTPPSLPQIENIVGTRFNHQTRGEFPSWEDWSPYQRSRMREITEPVASSLGYLTREDAQRGCFEMS